MLSRAVQSTQGEVRAFRRVQRSQKGNARKQAVRQCTSECITELLTPSRRRLQRQLAVTPHGCPTLATQLSSPCVLHLFSVRMTVCMTIARTVQSTTVFGYLISRRTDIRLHCAQSLRLATFSSLMKPSSSYVQWTSSCSIALRCAVK